jgi:hypothetical protein
LNRRLRRGSKTAGDAWVGIQSLGALLDAVIDGRPLSLPVASFRFDLHPPGAWGLVISNWRAQGLQHNLKLGWCNPAVGRRARCRVSPDIRKQQSMNPSTTAKSINSRLGIAKSRYLKS